MAVAPSDNGIGPESSGTRPEQEKVVTMEENGQDDAPTVTIAKEGAQVQEQQQEQEQEPGLPFSKARCIALVATVTGAAFLNVSLSALSILFSFFACF